MQNDKKLKIALAGNPNCGKSSIFNALTGSHQHVGNYPGVTVEKKHGFYRDNDFDIEVVDLPGTYSLTSYSPEERIARREILESTFDVVVVIVDSTNLRRNLYLMTQIMLTQNNTVLCLNMSDEAKKSGQKLDLELMESLLGFPIVETIGHKAIGIDKLKKTIMGSIEKPVEKQRLVLGDLLEEAVSSIIQMLEDVECSRPKKWIACKLLEEDPMTIEWCKEQFGDKLDEILSVSKEIAEQIEEETGLDVVTFMADRNYGFVAGLLHEVTLKEARRDSRALSNKIDNILCHRQLGLLFFFIAMYLLFYATFTLGEYPMAIIESFFGWLGETIGENWPGEADHPLKSLIIDGIISGVGGVVIFLPNILLLFFGLAIMEDTGYMARAAFLVDRVMHKFGLHGKSFIPMMTGFGCTIPGVMATRTLENERDRLTTMLVLPLISCGARLPIWMLLIPAFFPEEFRAPMLWVIYMVGIILAVVFARLLRSTLLKGEEAPFVMELPPYRVPTIKALVGKMFERGWLYVRKAGTIILGISIVLWIFSSYPKPDAYEIDQLIDSGKVVVVENVEKANNIKDKSAEIITSDELEKIRGSEELLYSAAGRIGKFMEPVIGTMGFDWRIGTALIGAFAAKEVFVSQMSIVFSLGGEDEGNVESLRGKLKEAYNPVIAFSLMLFLLIATPCMATFAIVKRESNSWKWAMLQFGGLTVFAWILSTIVYQVGRLFL